MSTLTTNELINLSACQIIDLLKTHQITPIELINVVENRIHETDNLINATPIQCFHNARKRVEERNGEPFPPPLYGLPILVKDVHCVKGELDTRGFLPYKDRIADENDDFVQCLVNAGGIIVGKTNVPEFAAGSHTFNSIYGTTKSALDLRVSAGGSSGGSAAALAAGQCWLATGSDLGGSLRIPSCFNGVVGFRTSPGRVIKDGWKENHQNVSNDSTP
jgi:amidase